VEAAADTIADTLEKDGVNDYLFECPPILLLMTFAMDNAICIVSDKAVSSVHVE
jgi:hypothetical protein